MSYEGYFVVCITHPDSPSKECIVCYEVEEMNRRKTRRNLMDVSGFGQEKQEAMIVDHVHGPQPNDHPNVTSHVIYVGSEECPICKEQAKAEMNLVALPGGNDPNEKFIPCGDTEDSAVCACGCSGYDERCALYLHYYNLGVGAGQVPESHRCCRIPGRGTFPNQTEGDR